MAAQCWGRLTVMKTMALMSARFSFGALLSLLGVIRLPSAVTASFVQQNKAFTRSTSSIIDDLALFMTTEESASLPTTITTSAGRIEIPGPPLPLPVPTNAKRLFLVRHGEVINPGGNRPVFYGALDVPLSDLGQAEARAAADYLQHYCLQKVFCSPLKRAVYGAKQVHLKQQQRNSANPTQQQTQRQDLIVLDGLKELDRGAWCGKTKAEIGPQNLKRFDACDESITPDGGESYPTLKRRVLGARDVMLNQLEPGQAAAVVSHLQVTRSILSAALGIPTSRMTDLPVATASVTCIDYYYDTDGNINDASKAVVHFQSFKPHAGLQQAQDGAN